MTKIGLTYLMVCLNCFFAFSQSWNSFDEGKEYIFSYEVNDTLEFEVFLVENPYDGNKYYASKLLTNVCSDQICLPIEINLFWDLLGNFHHFSREEDFNFTKFDHKYFEKHDYEKLQQILMDTLSALRDYDVEDLIDKNSEKFSVEIDAVTRPTSALFSNVTVPGALYTVYTLWHIVNGSIKQRLHAYTKQHYRERNWPIYFARSKVSKYQEYFLKNVSSMEINTYQKEIIDLLFATDDFVPHYAIDILEQNVFKKPQQYNRILKRLNELEPHVITEILNTISAPNKETLEAFNSFLSNPKVTAKQKEIIQKLINYEK